MKRHHNRKVILDQKAVALLPARLQAAYRKQGFLYMHIDREDGYVGLGDNERMAESYVTFMKSQAVVADIA